MEQVIRLEVLNSLEESVSVFNSVEQYWSINNLNRNVLFNIQLALDELFSNIVRHAYKDEGTHKVFFNAYRDNSSFIIEFIDDGKHFDPLSLTEPDVTADVDNREPGGLGIYLVKSFSEKMSYKREDGKNQLSVTFNLNKENNNADLS